MSNVNCLIMLRNLLPALDAAGREEVIETLNQELTVERLSKMSMKDVWEFSLICEDVVMTEFFSREELVDAGYMSEEEMRGAEFESMYL